MSRYHHVRKALVAFGPTTVNLTDTALLGGNKQRIGLIISAPAANRVSVAFGSPAELDRGMTLHSGTAPVQLIPSEYG